MSGRRDHRPDPNHRPAPVYCLVCDEEIKHVYDPKSRKRYWRHGRTDQGPIEKVKPVPKKKNHRRHADGGKR